MMMRKFESLLIKTRYKIAKLNSLLPTRQKIILSEFEDKKIRKKFYSQMWSNAANNLGYEYTDMGYGYWCITANDGKCVKGNIHGIELDTDISVHFAGNKPLTHKTLRNVPGYTAPKYCEFDLLTIQKAKEFIHSGKGPYVVKPAQGTGAGNGVTTGVRDYETLKTAVITASIYSKKLLIEDTVTGNSYRILILNNKFIHAIRRDPPQIVGDGKSTISDLIRKENSRRRDSIEIVSLSPITIDRECVNTLRSKQLRLNSVPDNGEIIIVKSVINQNASEQNVVVSDMVHPEIIQTSIDSAKKLGLELAGIDVLTTDISLPLSKTGGVINEINSNPGLHHHYLISEKRNIDIAENIIRHCMLRLN